MVGAKFPLVETWHSFRNLHSGQPILHHKISLQVPGSIRRRSRLCVSMLFQSHCFYNLTTTLSFAEAPAKQLYLSLICHLHLTPGIHRLWHLGQGLPFLLKTASTCSWPPVVLPHLSYLYNLYAYLHWEFQPDKPSSLWFCSLSVFSWIYFSSQPASPLLIPYTLFLFLVFHLPHKT